jgi:hypothetical protein
VDGSKSCVRAVDELVVKSVTDIRKFNKDEQHSYFEHFFVLDKSKQQIKDGNLNNVEIFPLKAKSFHDTPVYNWPFPRNNTISPYYERRPTQEAFATFETGNNVTHLQLSEGTVQLECTSSLTDIMDKNSIIHSIEVVSDTTNVPVTLSRRNYVSNLRMGHPAHSIDPVLSASASIPEWLYDDTRTKDELNRPSFPTTADQEYNIWTQFKFNAFAQSLKAHTCDYDAAEDRVTSRGSGVESAGVEAKKQTKLGVDAFIQTATPKLLSSVNKI